MGVFKKARKKRIKNKIKKLNTKIEDLQGEGYGVFQPAWDEGGKQIAKYTQKVIDLQDRLKKFKKLGGAVGPNKVL
jgi:peptidoglycan hydrolase CwlO-like protein